MTRLPLRLRLTLVFSFAMAAVLVAVGALLYVRVGDSLTERVDESLARRGDELAAEVRAGELEHVLAGDDEEFAQVLAADGEVVSATPGFETPLVAGGGQAPESTETEVVPPGEDETEPARLLALPVGERLAVVGASLEDRDEALAGLLTQLLVVGPAALLLAAVASYLLGGAALRPVEAMRRRAAEISAETSAERLPLTNARDEIHRLGETLNAMLDRLDAGLRRERRFVADAGHELRTPLALLQTELELALRRPRTAAELEGALRSAAEEVDRLARLADDLLVLASTADGRLPLQTSTFTAGELLEGVARRFRPRAAAAGRELEAVSAPGLALSADRLRLEQALGNLVDNALRHGKGAVRLEATADGRGVALRVSDRGSGFPPGLLPRAFERFSRADEARARGGAGLGLAIVEAVAHAHGGIVTAENGAGGGAVIIISLPSRSHSARE
jgi:heavy metal sensor kinase